MLVYKRDQEGMAYNVTVSANHLDHLWVEQSQVEWQTGLRLPVARYLAIQTARWHWSPLQEAVAGQNGADRGSLLSDIWTEHIGNTDRKIRNTRSKDVQSTHLLL